MNYKEDRPNREEEDRKLERTKKYFDKRQYKKKDKQKSNRPRKSFDDDKEEYGDDEW